MTFGISLPRMKRALVISGGGAKGAWAGGVAEYLIREKNYNYIKGVGSSTGSILLPHLLLGEIDQIKHIYTHTRTQDIFSHSPFVITQKDGQFSVKLNHLNILGSFLNQVPTFGDSHRLLHKIRKEFTKQQFDRLKSIGKEVLVTVSNLTTQKLEYKSSQKESYFDFVEWIWGSANYVPFMSILQKNGFEYADGGFASIIPVDVAVDFEDVDVVDVIILSPKENKVILPKSTNAFQTLSKVFDLSMNNGFSKDLMLGQLKSSKRQIDVHIYYTPELLTEYPLIFDPETMSKWWEMGFEYARNNEPECYCHQPKSTI